MHITSALVSKGQISVWHIYIILKLALYKYHIINITLLLTMPGKHIAAQRCTKCGTPGRTSPPKAELNDPINCENRNFQTNNGKNGVVYHVYGRVVHGILNDRTSSNINVRGGVLKCRPKCRGK